MTTKLRRMLLCLGLVLSMSFLLFGCGPNNQDANATGAPEDTIDESIDESTDAAEGTEVMEESSESTPEIDTDPLAPLRVDDAFAEKYGGLYLVRNGFMYTLNGDMVADNSSTVGQKKRSDNYTASLYQPIGGEGYSLITMGDVPLITLEEGDELRGYGIDNIDLLKTEFTGYSVRACEWLHGSMYIFTSRDDWPVNLDTDSAVEKFAVKDSNGNVVEDFRNLDYLSTYTVCWYENVTEYHETEMVADCKRYASEDIRGKPFENRLYADLTEYNYSVFDFSSLEPGTYYVHNSVTTDGLIEIK